MRTTLFAGVLAAILPALPAAADEMLTWPKSEPEWPMEVCLFEDNFFIKIVPIAFFHEETGKVVDPISMDILTYSAEIRDTAYIRWAPHTEVEVQCLANAMLIIIRSDTFFEVLVPKQYKE